MRILASAPGKIILTGEYAVLVGAPALAIAIDRRVHCTVRDADSGGWTFTSHGFASDATHSLRTLLDGPALARADPAHLCQHVLRQILEHSQIDALQKGLPGNLHVDIDSRAGFEDGKKLGIGTSAAVCVALCGALLARCGSRFDRFALALAAHRAAQDGRGSGIDVAAACHGGCIRYESLETPRTARVPLPSEVSFVAIWTGSSADTREHIAQFDTWRKDTTPDVLAALVDASAQVADAVSDSEEFMRQLRAYTASLRTFDDAAGLGIYCDSHRMLSELAIGARVVYKPCGAGGGDLGMAFSLDTNAIESFEHAAVTAGFKRLPVELDEHGITVGVEG